MVCCIDSIISECCSTQEQAAKITQAMVNMFPLHMNGKQHGYHASYSVWSFSCIFFIGAMMKGLLLTAVAKLSFCNGHKLYEVINENAFKMMFTPLAQRLLTDYLVGVHRMKLLTAQPTDKSHDYSTAHWPLLLQPIF